MIPILGELGDRLLSDWVNWASDGEGALSLPVMYIRAISLSPIELARFLDS